ncbi:MAG: sigma-54 dependent transcriptional regulator [Myxococcota bacterium]|nr:sigma-54-dependent Fis family transcriptional regulator [Myxococcales bacterium]
MARILIADGEEGFVRNAAATLHLRGHEVVTCGNLEEATRTIAASPPRLVLTDLRLEGGGGLELLDRVRRDGLGCGVILTTSLGSIESAVEAIQRGALNYLRKPIEQSELVSVVEEGLAKTGSAAHERSRSVATDVDLSTLTGIVGSSRSMLDLLALVEKVADTDSSVLITGETGVGKELIGRAIHRLSRRADRVFCAVNSAAFPETLLESELFGHRRGAFTGATGNKKGLFEFAHEGTVFLDEVAEMPLSMQVKLLRFLQTGEVRPVGDETTRYVDVRVVAATNKNLEREVAAGTFREDLYYRLAVIPIHVPPLRERPEDIRALSLHFLERFAQRAGKPVETISADAMELLVGYAWPGNVRQLENSIERGVALCHGREIRVEDLPMRLKEESLVREGETIHSLQVMERSHILNTLEQVNWNRKRAAALLQISTTTLWRRLKEFGIETDGSRRPPVAAQSPR